MPFVVKQDGAKTEFPVKLMCSDSGRHRPRYFGRHAEDWREETLSWRCPTCGREAQLGTAVLSKAATALADAGFDTLDVSLLPF